MGLTAAIGLEVIGQYIVPLSKATPATFIGSGKVAEIASESRALEPTVIIVNAQLSPVQQRNLEKAWATKVLDRTALILEIFGERAQTREGRLQVELAHLTYQRSRLVRSWTHLERQRGGFGFLGGPGETQIEADRRMIRDRMARIRRELEQVRRTRALHRKRRERAPWPVIALVGYTNAGKSTLFNTLTSATVLAENKLFATLDPTTRYLTLPSHQEVLLTDTVGFIQKLPTTLVAAFRGTLEEVVEADVLLEVVDATHENAIEQSQTVDDVLRELGAADKPRVTALNKIDLLTDPGDVDLSLFPNAVAVSARTGANLDALLMKLGETLADEMVRYTVLLPYDRGDMVEVFHRRGHVIRQEAQEQGTLIEGTLPRQIVAAFASWRVAPETTRRAARRQRGQARHTAPQPGA